MTIPVPLIRFFVICILFLSARLPLASAQALQGNLSDARQFAIASTSVGAQEGPLRVFIMLGQSNMIGFGKIEPEATQGTLAHLTAGGHHYTNLVDDSGEWAVRNDVWIVKTTVGQRQGWLAPGYGARGGLIGPELQFGHLVGDFFDEPVLLIKAAQGNRSLGWDILPPGSQRYEFEGRVYAGYQDTPSSWITGEPVEPVDWYAGKQYDDFVRDIHEVLNNLPRFFPDYDAERGFEISGFVWWQGHKDQNAAHASRYEANLVRLIHCLREEFSAREAPFVLATIAFNGHELSGHGLTVLDAQLAVDGASGKYTEFAGNVSAVDVRDSWRDKSVSPTGQGHHYNHNAATYLEVGDALGHAMLDLIRNP